MKHTDARGFSILEVMVATILFSLAAAAIVSVGYTMYGMGDQTCDYQAKMLAEQIAAELNSKVKYSTWNTPGSDLFPGVHNPPPVTIDNYNYVVTYTTQDVQVRQGLAGAPQARPYRVSSVQVQYVRR